MACQGLLWGYNGGLHDDFAFATGWVLDCGFVGRFEQLGVGQLVAYQYDGRGKLFDIELANESGEYFSILAIGAVCREIGFVAEILTGTKEEYLYAGNIAN